VASDHRRPNDHLVEPLFSGIDGAHEESRAVHPRPRGHLILVLVLVLVVAAAAVGLALVG